MKINNSTDIEVCALFELADHSHEFHRWLCIGLGSIIREIEMVVGHQWEIGRAHV